MPSQTLISTPLTQYLAWLLALLALILALYMSALNAWRHPIARRVGLYLFAVLLSLAIYTFAIGGLVGASNPDQARLPTVLLAISIPAFPAAYLLSSIGLLRSEFMLSGQQSAVSGQQRYRTPWSAFEKLRKASSWKIALRWAGWFLILLPTVLTAIDLLMGRYSVPFRVWYSGIDPASGYSGGYVPSGSYLNGSLRGLVIVLNIALVNLSTLGFLIYEAFANLPNNILKKSASPGRQISKNRTMLAWLLLISFIPGMAISIAQTSETGLIFVLFSNGLMIAAFAFAIFQQVLEGATWQTAPTDAAAEAQPVQTGGASLQARLVSATIVVVIPLLATMGLMLIRQAQQQLEANAALALAQVNQSLGDQVSAWVESNIHTLEVIANSPAIRSMDPASQKAMLESAVAAYPGFYLMGTIDLKGKNLARSDSQAGRDYSSQPWFQKASGNTAIIYQPLVGRDIWKPDLVIVIPIYEEGKSAAQGGSPAGYLMALSTLDVLSGQFQATRLGEEGFALLVDEQNRLMAHPDWAQEFIQSQYGLQDMSSHPPVAALAAPGTEEQQESSTSIENLRFIASDEQAWQAAIRRLDNGWGLIVQQSEQELLAPIASFQRIALLVLLAGVAMLIPLMLLTVRNSLLPVKKLTEAARQVAAGDLGQLAPVEVTAEPGEIGVLASTFNSMTLQLRQLIGGLEQRVAERTQAVQRRAIQLQVTAEVAREAASIRNPEELMHNIVNLISERFGFYHAGIFLLPGSDQQAGDGEGYAVLQAASSEGGQRMLARRHRLKIGPGGSGVGIVGYVAYAGQPRIALDVGEDAVFFSNPDLPATRSEMALPLMVAATDQRIDQRMQQIGSTNARIRRRVIGVLDVQSTQESAFSQEDVEILQILADQVAVALENARLLSESQEALRQLETVYGERIRQRWQERLRKGGLSGSDIVYTFGDQRSVISGQQSAVSNQLQDRTAVHRLTAYIELRGQRLGSVTLQRERPWSEQEQELIQQTMDQVALAVENARLLEEIQQRAFQEEIIGQMVAQAQKSLDLDTVMRNLVQEVAQTVNATKIQLHLASAAGAITENAVEGEGDAEA